MKTRLVSYIVFPMVVSIGLPLAGAASAERARGSTNSDTSAQIVAAATPASAGADYLLQPQDVLRVHVFQHDDLNKQSEAVSISQDFTIFLPLIQTITVRGKTVREAEEAIRDAYNKDYLVNPQVSVYVVKYAERSVSVVGSVGTSGRIGFPQERGMSIVEAISQAGPTRLADLKRVKLTRRTPDGDNTTEEINVDAMMKGNGRDAPMLQKDDIIFVPERIL